MTAAGHVVERFCDTLSGIENRFSKTQEHDVNYKERHRKIKKSSKKAIGKDDLNRSKRITQLRETLLRRQIQDWVILPRFSGILFVDFGAVRF